ncbi:MAG: ectoine synthase [Acidisphaera sp.]|nr:ectoine synthase [Acidisphaera sp.]
MIVRSKADVEAAGHFVQTELWSSARYLTQADGVGFSLNDTRVRAGAEQVLEYRHHIEACLCIEGEGELEALEGGARHRLAPGVLYALDRYDRHCVRARTDLRVICVFSPALRGDEVHDAAGGYASSG